MSIIQEALRKAQKPESIQETGTSKRYIAPKAEKKSMARPALYALIFLVALSILALKYLSPTRPKASVNLPVPISAPIAEIIEVLPADEPVIEKQSAVQPVPIQPLSLPKEDFTLSGIMHLEDGLRAIVNGSTVVEGDVVDGAVVMKITDRSVLLKRRNADIILYLK